MRTIFIGDVHVCNDALKCLLQKVKMKAGKDKFFGGLY